MEIWAQIIGYATALFQYEFPAFGHMVSFWQVLIFNIIAGLVATAIHIFFFM